MAAESGKLRHRNLPLLLLQAREHVIARFRPDSQRPRHHGAAMAHRPRTDRHGTAWNRAKSARCAAISSPSLAGVLSRMEELGYIQRKRLDHDQRRVRVSLTPRSRALAARMAPQIEATYRDIETVIGAGVFDAILSGSRRNDRRAGASGVAAGALDRRAPRLQWHGDGDEHGHDLPQEHLVRRGLVA